ncbi:hypothetical protein BJY01DRAFT_255786 [Aspergillus pseudoustus]|uniref:G domain-containing protein n=1 Tax=Aspergillus pseudoustus TaxID=1810923 RepID=A0ABR4IH87_9EURO
MDGVSNAGTTHVDVYAYEASPSQTVYLIDTPGFDDTNRSDTEVLKEIARWLVASYKGKILLNGIIYLHRIADIPMQGSARKNLIMFRQLCGENALKRVVLVTTMWDKVPEDEAVRREKKLIDTPEFWGWMLGKGSSCQRHYNTEDSALVIVNELAGHTLPVATELQRQMVDEKKELGDTSTGQELQSEMVKEKAKWAQERREIAQQLKLAIEQRDHDAEETMREERDRYTRMIQKVKNDTETLKLTMNKLLAERDERVAKMERMMREQEAVHRTELESVREYQRQIARTGKEKPELQIHEPQSASGQVQVRAGEVWTLPPIMPKRMPGGNMTYYGLAIQNSHFILIDGHERQEGMDPVITSGTFGDTHDGVNWTFLARCRSEGWSVPSRTSFPELTTIIVHHPHFGDAYPKLQTSSDKRGSRNLKLFSLGPKGTYYARWFDGYWECHVSAEIHDLLRRAHNNGKVAEAVALGYGGSYVISYGHPGHGTRVPSEKFFDLKGYYGNFHQQKWFPGTKIIAIALDISCRTDFVMIHTDHSEALYHIYLTRHVSGIRAKDAIDRWWKQEGD